MTELARDADGEIFAAVWGPLLRFARVLVGPSDAPDIVSIVVLRTLERRTLASLDDPRAYLMRAVLNESRTRRRRHRKLESVIDTIVASSTVQQIDRADVDMISVLMGLPIKQRAAVYFKYWVGLNSEETGDVIGCRPATVRRYLHLARAKLESRV